MHKLFKKLAIIALSALLMGCATNPGTDEPVRRPETEAATPEPTTAPEPTQAVEITKKGCETWNELVGMYLDWMNGNISNQDFLQSFDETVCCAVLMLNEEPSYSDMTIEQAYQLIETQGSQPDEDILAYLSMIEAAVPGLEAELDEIKAEINRLNGAQTSIHSDNLKEQRGGYWNYVVETPATEAGGSVFRLVFAKRDGLFYWGTISAAKSAVREEPTPVVENQKKGYATKGKLVEQYLKWLNGNISNEEFLQSFDETVFGAIEMLEDAPSYSDLTIEQAYQLIEMQGSQPDEEMQAYLTMIEVAELLIESEMNEVKEEISNLNGVHISINPDNLEEQRGGVWYYKVSVPTSELDGMIFTLVFAEREGCYYWGEIWIGQYANVMPTPTPTPVVENQQKGCETKEELVGKYLEWLNGDLSGAEFLAYFDEEVYLAYWLTEDYYSIAPTMEEAYGVLEDKENQPESVRKLLNKEAGIVEQYASAIDAIYTRMSSYQTHETEVNPDYFWKSKAGYVRYVIPVEDEEIRSIGIYMAERDGRYYWSEIYRTAK